MKQNFYYLLVLLTLSIPMSAQQHVYNAVSTIANTIPFQSGPTQNFRQWIYYPSNFPAAASGNITDIYIKASNSASLNFTNLNVKMGTTTLMQFTTSYITTGLQTVYNGAYSQATVTGDFIKITLQTPYYYNNTENLVVEVSQTGYSPGVQIEQGSVGYTGRSLFGAAANTSGTVQHRLATFGFDIMSAPCTNPVAAGTTTKSPTTNVCPGISVGLDLTGNGIGTGITYEWESSPNNAAGSYVSIGASQVTAPTTAQPAVSTWYRCKVICSGGAPSYSTPVQVLVDAVNVNLGNDTTFCEGNSAIILNAGNSGSTFLWDDASTTQTRSVDTAGTYFVTVTSPAGCEGSDTINVSFSAAAAGDFTTTEGANGIINFSATATNTTIYFWQFGANNASATGSSTSYTYGSNGFYNVTLNLINDCGDTTKVTKSVTVSNAVGIKEIIKGAKVSIFPNPANSILMVENESGLEFKHIKIIDVLGKTVYTERPKGLLLNYKIDLNHLNAGAYYLEIQTPDGRIIKTFSVK